jgi:hypothetical protein
VTTPAVAWSTAAEVVDGPCAGLTDDDATALDRKLLIATQLLYLATGRKWPGTRSDYYRPNRGSCGCSYARPGCNRVPEVRLPGYPVIAITEVLIDGSPVDADTYRLDDKRYLVRLPATVDDRNEGWPCCQRMDLDDTELNTFSIAYTWGAKPDHAGLAAQQALGCELHLASNPETASQCRLPKSIVSAITRQGVSYDFTRGINLATCGLIEVTMWLDALATDRKGTMTGARIIDPAAIARRGRRARRPYVPGS